jgi:transposase-like protein
MKILKKRRTETALRTWKTWMGWAAGLLSAFAMCGCSQGLNWREISVDDSAVSIWLPCKPSEASREIPLSADPGVGEIKINMVGCEKDSMQFAVSYIDEAQVSKLKIPKNVGSDSALNKWMQLWERASLSSLGIREGVELRAWPELKVETSPKAQYVRVKNESAIEAQFLWFGYRGTLYQVALFSASPLAQNKVLLDTYFDSLQIKLQP